MMPRRRRERVKALHVDDARLGRLVRAINQLAAKVTRLPGVKLCRYHPAGRSYTAHPATRRMLRELLAVIESSGEHEEPLWEAPD